VLRKHRLPASVRQLLPPIFFLLTVISLVLALLLPGKWMYTAAAALPVAYGAMLLGAGVEGALKRGWQVGLIFPAAAFIMHSAYSAGFSWGMVNGNGNPVSRATSSKSEFHAPTA